MRSPLNIAIVFIFGVLIFMSCKNDLKITAPYKEIPQVYAIITPQESMQMIRINKIFLGEGDATVMAKQPDSVNYQPGELTVWLERYSNGSKIPVAMTSGNTEVYFRDSVVQTEPGAFSTTQRVYVCNDKLYSSGLYKLTIKNNHTGNVFTASTNALDSMPLTYFQPFAWPYLNATPAYTPAPSDPTSYFIDYHNQNIQQSVYTKPVPGAYIHDLTIRIHYYDSIFPATPTYPTGKILHVYDYIFFPKQLTDLENLGNNKFFIFRFGSPSLFGSVASDVTSRPNPSGFVGRKMYRIDFMTYAATQDYYDFLQFSAPSLSFSQEKVLYSNFDNRAAMGIFTFKSRSLVAKVPATGFIDEFCCNKNTNLLNFYKSNLNTSCP
jgi:hypothetical protein